MSIISMLLELLRHGLPKALSRRLLVSGRGGGVLILVCIEFSVSRLILPTHLNADIDCVGVVSSTGLAPIAVLYAYALKLRQGQLHFFKWSHVSFFDDIITDFQTNSATYNTRSF